MILTHDEVTQEWFFNGKWYDHYPKEEIDRLEHLEQDRGDLLYHQRRDEGA